MHFLKKTRGWKLPLLAILGLIFSFAMVLSRHPAPAKEPAILPPTSPYANSVAGIGIVEPKSEIINVGSEISAVIRYVSIKIGDQVKKGDPLFILDQRDIDSQIKVFKATLQAVRAQAKEAIAQFSLVKNVRDNRAVAQDDYNHRQYNAEFMSAKVDEAVAQLDQAFTTKERLTIRAPIDGQILHVNVRPGEFAQAGVLAEPLIRMGDMSTRHVRVEIDEENASNILPSSQAIGYRRGDTKNRIKLTFVRFEPYVRPKQNLAVVGQRVDTRVFQVIYALEPTNNSCYVGEQMDVYISKY